MTGLQVGSTGSLPHKQATKATSSQVCVPRGVSS